MSAGAAGGGAAPIFRNVYRPAIKDMWTITNFEDTAIVINPENVARYLRNARKRLKQSEEIKINALIRHRLAKKQKQSVSINATQMVKKVVEETYPENLVEQTKLLEAVDEYTYGDIERAGSVKPAVPVELQDELGALGDESHSVEERINQMHDAMILAWQCFTRPANEEEELPQAQTALQIRIREAVESGKTLVEYETWNKVLQALPKSRDTQHFDAIFLGWLTSRCPAGSAEVPRYHDAYEFRYENCHFCDIYGFRIYYNKLFDEIAWAQHRADWKLLKPAQFAEVIHACQDHVKNYYENPLQIASVVQSILGLSDPESLASLAYYANPKEKTFLLDHSEEMDQALSPDDTLLTEFSFFKKDHIEFYRDLDDAIKDLPNAATRNRNYRMMAGRARPPLLEFGIRGRWYMGSGATPKFQAIDMCFKFIEAYSTKVVNQSNLSAPKKEPDASDARPKLDFNTFEALSGIPVARLKNEFENDEDQRYQRHANYLDYKALKIIANRLNLKVRLRFGDNTLFINASGNTVLNIIKAEGHSWESEGNNGIEFIESSDDELQHWFPSLPPNIEPINMSFALKDVALWWYKNYDGWAMSTVADNHAVQNAGLSYMSPLFTECMLPHLLQQHRALWCPNERGDDLTLGTIFELLLNCTITDNAADEPEPSPPLAERERREAETLGADAESLKNIINIDKYIGAVSKLYRTSNFDGVQFHSKWRDQEPKDWTGLDLLSRTKMANAATLNTLLSDFTDAVSELGKTQTILKSMAVIDDQEGAIAVAMRTYVRTEHGQESLCVVQNFTEVTPRFAVARATVIEAVRHLWTHKPTGEIEKCPPELLMGSGVDVSDQSKLAAFEEDRLIVSARMFPAAMIAAGAIVAHERYTAGYSDPRGLQSAKHEFKAAVSAIASELHKRRKIKR